jgi:hypothetical protein
MLMYHEIGTLIFGFLGRKLLDAGWNKGKQLVQAAALYYLFGLFVLSFVASYISQPCLIAGPGRVGCPETP